MRIDNSNNSVNAPRSNEARPSSHARGNADNAIRSQNAVDPKSDDSLLQLVASTTEVRESVVNDIKTKIQNGDLLARQTAVETANAILDL